MQNDPAMKAFVVTLLKDNLPPYYTYHNPEHTVYVVDKALEIGNRENCTTADLELLYAAALWHDTGYIHTYVNHEEAGCTLAEQYLPGFGFTQADIGAICGMIMATKIPQSPKNRLEEILADADLEYLGTENAGTKADDFFRELQHLNPSLTKAEWNKTQVAFLQKHRYFTAFCKKHKEPVKQEYLYRLIPTR